ncbi:hypothetical protein R9C00_07180 [Flammeovirgaceae bacterium SG7u.111]|nr:hypothetical protein [Flammeovirgaceae bacterium SG7u.132]WPO37227.1 hypothetical protein R9C00_07180 [Flammeovirgaceae bacterium SG7u.111]
MKINTLLFFALLLASSCAEKAAETNIATQTEETMETPQKQLSHIVLFKFQGSATQTDIGKVEAPLSPLPLK